MIISEKPWERPVLPPLPEQTGGLETPVISLAENPSWRMAENPSGTFWAAPQPWAKAFVPMDMSAALATGGSVTQDPTDNQDGANGGGKCRAWQCDLKVPAAWAGYRVILRFLGAGCAAKAWIDGVEAGAHYGCFTPWDCDITELATPGGINILTLRAEDRPGELSPYQAGGILRDVLLIAVPRNAFARLDAEPIFSEDGTVSVQVRVKACSVEETRLTLRLISPEGTGHSPIELAVAPNGEATAILLVRELMLWDSEHPWLYTLHAELSSGETRETATRTVGLRQIEVRGETLYINGRPVKLRGLARHETSALRGKSPTKEQLEQEITLYKEANVNFIRCAHYPPEEAFLVLCDHEGIYVQDEAPVAYVDWRLPATQNDPKQRAHYMSQFAELVERDRGHACVIIWGLGSDCSWGSNFKAEYDYIKAQEPSRPVLFNYPMTMPESGPLPDIWSVHYADPALDLGAHYDHMIIGHTHGSDEAPGYALGRATGLSMPVLHDEFAMPACYNRDQQKNDPAVREFWGESIRRFAEKLWATPGALGGAVWCGMDETNLYTGGTEDSEWGVLDPWLRKKPEYYHLKKAYTPVKLPADVFEVPADGFLRIPVENRFNHTCLDELAVLWSALGCSGELTVPPVAPGATGELSLRLDWVPGMELTLTFVHTGRVVEERKLTVGKAAKPAEEPALGAPVLEESETAFVLRCGGHVYTFRKSDGLLESGALDGKTIMTDGPRLHMTGIRLPEWSLGSIAAEGGAGLCIRGTYGETAEIIFHISLDDCGKLKTAYEIDKLTRPMPRRVKANVGLDCGGLDELGVSYDLAPDCTDLSWERDGIWKEYPEDHIGRVTGTASAFSNQEPPAFGEEPKNGWALDEVSYGLYGKYDLPLRGTNDFRSMKHHIRNAACSGNSAGMEVLSDGSASVRAELLPAAANRIDDRDPSVKYCGDWYQTKDESGCWMDTETVSKTAGDWLEYSFNGTGICWYGASDMIYGMADVYIDGQKQAANLSMYAEAAEKPGFSRGYEKRYNRLVYAVQGLPMGEHTLKIQVTGKKEPQSQNTHVSVDCLRVLRGEQDQGAVRLLVCSAYNYTRLCWGNYMNPPIHVAPGHTGEIVTRLRRRD